MILRINSICDLLGDGGLLFMILLQYSRFTKILWQGPGEVGWYSRRGGGNLAATERLLQRLSFGHERALFLQQIVRIHARK